MSASADRVRSLSPDKLALLKMEIERRQARTGSRGIVARAQGAPPVLSLAQERLWFLDQMYPGSSTYNATLTMQLRGRVDAAAIHRAADTVVARHEALRTVVERGSDGKPTARLLPAEVGAQWECIRVDATPDDLLPRLRDLAAKPFDLANDVMLRAYLFELDVELCVLMFVTNHIASDGWSRDVLFTELTESYNAIVADVPAKLPDLPVQYGDYAIWQRNLADSSEFEATLDFWRAELDGADLILDLPTDRPRPSVATFAGARLGFEDNDLGEQMRRLGRDAAATAYMTYLAVIATMCHALTGQTDFLLGSPSANRDRPETTRLIGFFVDTMVVRVPLRGDPTFLDVLARSREAVLRSLGHPVPLDRLVDAIRPKRVSGRNPLFQVNYRMQGAPPPLPNFSGVAASRMFVDVGASRFDLAFGFIDAPGLLRGYIEYNSALFTEQTAQAWVDGLLTLIRAVIARPTVTLAELSSLVRSAVGNRTSSASLPPAGPVSRPIRRRQDK